jgi:putative membrane protein
MAASDLKEHLMPSQQDINFVQQATAAGLTEVTEGSFAARVSQNPAVAGFGQRMVADHTVANNQLAAIAAQEGIQQPAVLPPAEQQEIVSLEQLTDPQFSQTYIHGQVTDHGQTLRLFINEAITGQDPTLVAFARGQIPVLASHLTEAMRLDLMVQPGVQPYFNAVVSALVPDSLLSRASAVMAGTSELQQIMASLHS